MRASVRESMSVTRSSVAVTMFALAVSAVYPSSAPPVFGFTAW